MAKPVVFYESAEEGSEESIKIGDNSLGIRVFYFSEKGNCDHSECHNQLWKKRLEGPGERCLEAGTVISVVEYSAGKHSVTIRWDCGEDRCYTIRQLDHGNIRVFDLGPAGDYHLVVVIYTDRPEALHCCSANT